MQFIRAFVRPRLCGGLLLAGLCGLSCGLALRNPVQALASHHEEKICAVTPAVEFP
jgi:hypothetical protein